MHEPMGHLALAALSLAVSLLLGRLALESLAAAVRPLGSRRRRWWATWARCAVSLRGPTIIAALVAPAAALLVFRSVPRHPALIGILILAGIPAATGCWLLVHAGWSQSRGRLRMARRQCRAGGLLMAQGLLLLMILSTLRAVQQPALVPWSVVPFAGAACVALLAALSRKPGLSGSVAALLYTTGHAAFAVSLAA